jgi:hypothetical protein
VDLKALPMVTSYMLLGIMLLDECMFLIYFLLGIIVSNIFSYTLQENTQLLPKRSVPVLELAAVPVAVLSW